MFEPYRPRRPTPAEQERDHEQKSIKRKRQAEKVAREREWRTKRSSAIKYSELDGIGYQDFILGPSGATRSRTQLDERAYHEYRTQQQLTERPLLDSVRSLSECCVELAAEHYMQLTGLDSAYHLAHAGSLIDHIRRIRNDRDRHLPFKVWIDFALEFGLDLPNKYKTYRGLVASTDQEELELIREYNDEAVKNRLREPSLTPRFCLAILDLSNVRTFADSDVYKLRHPLSSFLAVLKLDNTSITDGGIAWISRAASDSEAYKHLEMLSLKGLTRVTNDGVQRVSDLTNLRMLDLRDTGCKHDVVPRLNKSGIRPSWASPRPRKDLHQTLIEFQLFGGSLSLSRILSVLHHLARVHHAPLATLLTVTKAPLVKQLTIHLTEITRLSVRPTLDKNAEDKTMEERHKEQLSLSNYSGSALATHHASFGTLTSTKSLARKLVEEDGRALGEKGAAFRHGAGDSVALGRCVGPTGGRGGTNPHEAAARKAQVPLRDRQREPFSDTEDEKEREEALRADEAEALKIWEEQTSTGFSFYAGRKPIPKPERVIIPAQQSRLMLLRHIPFIEPYNRMGTASSTERGAHLDSQTRSAGPIVKVTEGSTLPKKKRRTVPDPITMTSLMTLDSSTIVSRKRLSPNSYPGPVPALDSSTTKRLTPTAARTDSKNVFSCTPPLAKRSSLSAFRR